MVLDSVVPQTTKLLMPHNKLHQAHTTQSTNQTPVSTLSDSVELLLDPTNTQLSLLNKHLHPSSLQEVSSNNVGGVGVGYGGLYGGVGANSYQAINEQQAASSSSYNAVNSANTAYAAYPYGGVGYGAYGAYVPLHMAMSMVPLHTAASMVPLHTAASMVPLHTAVSMVPLHTVAHTAVLPMVAIQLVVSPTAPTQELLEPANNNVVSFIR